MTEPNIEDPIVSLFREHPALLFSALYLAASIIGMFFSWSYMQQFGVNVFLYAEISDFLLASLKDPIIWLIVLGTVVFWYADWRNSRNWGAKRRPRWLRWYGSPGYRRLGYPMTIIVVLLLLQFFAESKATTIYDGEGDRVELRLADSDRRRSVTLLGTTSKFIFLFDANTERVFIHPNESIAEIRFLAPARSGSG
ncbi:MAG: hypothetical protein QNJ00_13535 [Woeseiaceae bacterium]|nr:hypothetical protein [Woeseiaceae bacterium]